MVDEAPKARLKTYEHPVCELLAQQLLAYNIASCFAIHLPALFLLRLDPLNAFRLLPRIRIHLHRSPFFVPFLFHGRRGIFFWSNIHLGALCPAFRSSFVLLKKMMIHQRQFGLPKQR
jgi:hypothetical protein